MPDSTWALILQHYNFQQFFHSFFFNCSGIFLSNFSSKLGNYFYLNSRVIILNIERFLYIKVQEESVVFLTRYQSSFMRFANWGEILVGKQVGEEFMARVCGTNWGGWAAVPASRGHMQIHLPWQAQVGFLLDKDSPPLLCVFSLALKSFLFRADHWDLFLSAAQRTGISLGKGRWSSAR